MCATFLFMFATTMLKRKGSTLTPWSDSDSDSTTPYSTALVPTIKKKKLSKSELFCKKTLKIRLITAIELEKSWQSF